MPQRKRNHGREPYWAEWSDQELLDLRLKDLGVTLEGSWVEECVERLGNDLEQIGLRFRPHVWVSSEWFSPRGSPGFAVPFYLLHPRLIRLERKKMVEAEGSNRSYCMKLLRHECGHAIQHAYQLHRRRRAQRVFGSSSTPYPDVYRPDPRSRDHVQYLRLYYAQSHPDEDFAETFAVWLAPRSNWRRRYADWPALEKLLVVDELMGELADLPALVRSRRREDSIERNRTTLRQHYEEKLAERDPHPPDVHDRDLRRLFREDDGLGQGESAAAFLRRNRTRVRRLVSRFTGEYEYTLEQVFDDLIQRCSDLKLRAVGRESDLRSAFAVLLATRTVHEHYSERHWVSM